jgi:hypothetical protein
VDRDGLGVSGLPRDVATHAVDNKATIALEDATWRVIGATRTPRRFPQAPPLDDVIPNSKHAWVPYSGRT